MNNWKQILIMGVSHLLVGFTSIVVVTRILNYNLPIAFLFAGIATLIFHYVTKNKLPVVLGVSGMYIGSILYVNTLYGAEYAMGGIIVAGLISVSLGIATLKYQDVILKYFPEWLLSTVVLMIGYNLLPIGVGIMEGNYLIGASAFISVILVDILGGKKLSLFAMPIGVLVGTLVGFLTGAIDYSVLNEPLTMEFMRPKFAWGAVAVIAPITFAIYFEWLGDSKNVSDISGVDIRKDVGIGRIAIGNGLATIVGGLFGANAYTTYSENTAFVMLSKYKNPKAQIVTALLMIVVAFLTPVMKLILLIPESALGGVVTYLFAMIIVNSIKQIVNTKVSLAQNRRAFVTMTTMIAISMMHIRIGEIFISSVAVATLIGSLMNFIILKVERRDI